jgi:hypothetical protein
MFFVLSHWATSQHTYTRREQGDIYEDVDVRTMNGTCLDSTGTKLGKFENWTDEDLNAAMLAVDNGAPIKTMARRYRIPTISLRNYVIGKIISNIILSAQGYK